MTEPLVTHPTFGQRVDLLAVAKPAMMRGNLWFFGILGVWSAIGAAASVIQQHWVVAAITLTTAVFSGLTWWLARRALTRVPATQQWIDELVRAREGPAE